MPKFAAPQDFPAELAHRSSWQEHVTVHGLAMAVHREHFMAQKPSQV